MDEIKIKIEGDAIEKLVAKAILDDIGPEQRDKLLQAALSELFKPMYDRGPTHLQHIFKESARSVAHRLIQEQLLNDPAFKERVETFIVGVVDKVLKNTDAIDAAANLCVAAFDKAVRQIKDF